MTDTPNATGSTTQPDSPASLQPAPQLVPTPAPQLAASPPAPQPAIASTPTNSTLPISPQLVGFLSIVHDPSGILGGYLITNSWGRPVEFRLTTAVSPNRVQQILYGPTLAEYLHADLIGKALVEKASSVPGLIVVDALPALALRTRVEVPVVAVVPKAGEVLLSAGADEYITLANPRSPSGVIFPAKFAADRELIEKRLEAVDPAVDLSEPFLRVREAVAEARKLGVTARAA